MPLSHPVPTRQPDSVPLAPAAAVADVDETDDSLDELHPANLDGDHEPFLLLEADEQDAAPGWQVSGVHSHAPLSCGAWSLTDMSQGGTFGVFV